jgi:hypothetical protein
LITIYGISGDEPGDKQVYESLKYLPVGWLVYAQPRIVEGGDEKNPDYVLLHQDYGYIVLEVKDYVSVERPDAKGLWVKRRHILEPEWEESPTIQAKKAAELINNKLVHNPDLRNYSGKLDFSYHFAGILPNLPTSTISWLATYWGTGKVLGYADLNKDLILAKITSIPPQSTARLTNRQFDAVRAVLDIANSARDSRTGEFKGIYSPIQEEISKSPFVPPDENIVPVPELKQEEMWGDISLDPQARMDNLSSGAPEEVLHLEKARNVKLVRGFSGTGKTDVLVLRARYLYDLFHEINMLVTSFNVPLVEERLTPEFIKQKDRIQVCTFDSLCTSIFHKHVGIYPTIQKEIGIIKNLENTDEGISKLILKYGSTFIHEEITWMKEAGLVERDAYLSTHRIGRAKISGKTLPQSAKDEIYQVFIAYQRRLQDEMRVYDWPDIHQKAWEFIQNGTSPNHLFDLIFIDEAQHFAPFWLKIIMAHLKPNGSIFLCDDPSQSVYRFYSWEQKGINVMGGRTRWLRIPYRTTREIFTAGYALIQSNPLAEKLMKESGDNAIPDLSNDHVRNGERPQVYCFPSYEKEKDFICIEIGKLVKKILPSEIAILHTEKYVIQAYERLVPRGVVVDDLKRRTGMEYKVVFIPQTQHLFSGSKTSFDYELAKAQHQLALYMAMTRARDQVYLLYGQKWPKEYEPLRSYVNWLEG